MGLCGFLLLGGCAPNRGSVSYGEFDQAFPKVREQAKQVQKQYPELFTYLSKRDGAVQKIAQAYLNEIPDPDNVPIVKDPFIDGVVVVVKKPEEDCSTCGEDCDNPFYTRTMRERCQKNNVIWCDICENGLFSIRGSLKDLVSPAAGGPQPEPPT